jgi:hypothetical protein
MMRRSARMLIAGPTIGCQDRHPENSGQEPSFPVNDRGIKSSFALAETNTATYEAVQTWTWMQPGKVNIEKMPAPEAKYYQVHTKRIWDVSSTEQMEIILRKRIFHFFIMATFVIYLYFFHVDERSYDGTTGRDPIWALLPKNRPEMF